AIRSALANVKAVAVMDKSMSFGGNGGPVFHEVRHLLYAATNHPYVMNYIYGLGGRDTSPSELRSIYETLQGILKTGRIDAPIQYLGLRG
ncbi:pyruvate ferredoxin oxidoreductase, partial [Candidatus Bathyarchaeota archaeon]